MGTAADPAQVRMTEQIGRRLGDGHEQIQRLLQVEATPGDEPGRSVRHHFRDRSSTPEELVHPLERRARNQPPLGRRVGQPAEPGSQRPRRRERRLSRSFPLPLGQRHPGRRPIEGPGGLEPLHQVAETAEQVAQGTVGGDLGVHEVQHAVVADEEEWGGGAGAHIVGREYKGQMRG